MQQAETFSITQFEQLSGIKSHTIRVWEIRYALFKPSRSKTQLRRYTLQDFKRLLDIALLNGMGYKISLLASLDPQQIENEIEQIADLKVRNRCIIHKLLVTMYAADYSEFENILNESVATSGIDNTIREIIIPFLQKIDLLSYKDHGTPTHFVVGAVRNKLIAGIENTMSSFTANNYALLLLPEGDHYDLILLFNAYQLKCAGVKFLYLGTNVPFKNLKELGRIQPPSMIVTYLPYRTRYNPLELSKIYQESFASSLICITRPQMKEPTLPWDERTRMIHYSELGQMLSLFAEN